TEGFRDILEIGRMRMPRLYDLTWNKPEPLIERRLRLEVPERIDKDGRIVRPLDEDAARCAIRRLLDEGIESLAIVFLHSYRNPAHERRVAELVAELAPQLDVSASHEVLPEIREYERTSTTVVNACVRPLVRRYLQSLQAGLAEVGLAGPVWVMQSSGGLMSAAAAAAHPVQIIESGPAAGVVGAARLGAAQGLRNLITFDMGGTTAKASLIEDGRVTRSAEYEVGAGLHAASRLLKGGGYLLRVPAVDVAEVGAGGGSIVWLDAGGALRVGPQSAGAHPGPVAYAQGGTEPTITDANLLLGYLNPEALAGGTLPLDAERARAVFRDRIARPAGLSLEQAAYGARTVANANMVRAVRAVSTERGRDPRAFALFAFGGNGPVHGVDVAAQMGIRRVIIPPAAGVFSSVGLLLARLERHFVRSFHHIVGSGDPAALEQAWAALEDEARAALEREGFAPDELVLERLVDVRYSGQSSELTLPFPSAARAPGAGAPAAGDTTYAPTATFQLVEDFHRRHRQEFGHAAPGDPVEIVNLRVICGLKGRASLLDLVLGSEAATGESLSTLLTAARGAGARGMGARGPGAGEHGTEPRVSRPAYFGPRHGWCETPVFGDRAALSTPRRGPLIVEEYDATIVVPPGANARLEAGHVVIEIEEIEALLPEEAVHHAPDRA
ncbi:MAG TPA: hydantoinase/oxoprolinase family protein, partial [Bacillota bacterium]